jgi:hypothetical protein
MDTTHLPRTCKWSIPTLMTPWPLWLDAWSHEWSCVRCGTFTRVADSGQCCSCPRWERDEESKGEGRKS